MEVIFKICGVVGLILVTWGVTIRQAEKRDKLFIFGGALLLVYSVYLKDLIFIALQSFYIIITTYHLHKSKNFWQRLWAIFN